MILSEAIPLLQTTRKFSPLTSDDVQIVIRELTPLLLHLSLEFFPISFNAIPIHGVTPFLFHMYWRYPSTRGAENVPAAFN